VPTRGDEAAQQGRARRVLVEVHRLRIVLGGEGDDLRAGDEPGSASGDLAWSEIFPVEAGHGDPAQNVFGGKNTFGGRGRAYGIAPSRAAPRPSGPSSLDATRGGVNQAPGHAARLRIALHIPH
jgi:hypothetical protein